jgi:predicted GIY-YIG superfamily endonuclease
MPFWTYMLQCRDRTLYVGHTDDLDLRLAQHEQGTFGGHTARKRPLTLVWSEEFPTRYEALIAERQIKGWRKEKKLALIRGDWGLISRLSREKKGRPSTSSGRTVEAYNPTSVSVRPEPVEGRHYPLLRHPSQVTTPVESLEAAVQRIGVKLSLRYVLSGNVANILIPPPAPPLRVPGLWHHTCFELFVHTHKGPAYYEFNFAPSGRWAAFRLAGYRQGMADADIAPPEIRTRVESRQLEVRVDLDLSGLDELAANNPWRAGLSAIVEDRSHKRSFWALAHPPGDPDFHDPACFAAELPPAEAP